MSFYRNITKAFFYDTSGVTAIQYGLIASLAGTAIVGSTTTMGGEVTRTLYTAAQTLAWGGGDDGLVGQGTFSNELATGLVDENWWHLDLATGLDGWDMSYPDPNASPEVEIKTSAHEGRPSDDSDYIDMNTRGPGQNLTLGRSVTMVPGQEYTISFEANDLTGTGLMEVVFGNEVVATIDAPNGRDFTAYEVNVVGGSGDGSDYVQFREIGDDTRWGGTGLANVQVQ